MTKINNVNIPKWSFRPVEAGDPRPFQQPLHLSPTTRLPNQCQPQTPHPLRLSKPEAGAQPRVQSKPKAEECYDGK